MKFPRNLKPFSGQLDVAPFAGVFFLLVLFLVLNTHLVPPPGVRIRLPEADADVLPGTVAPALVVTVDASGQLFFDHQPVEQAVLKRRLKDKVRELAQPVSLLIQADGEVQHRIVVSLSAVAKECNIQEVVIASRPKLIPPPEAVKPSNAP